MFILLVCQANAYWYCMCCVVCRVYMMMNKNKSINMCASVYVCKKMVRNWSKHLTNMVFGSEHWRVFKIMEKKDSS